MASPLAMSPMSPAGGSSVLARSTTSMGSLTALVDRAGELFELLAQGREAIGLQEFDKFSSCLAQLSGDFDLLPEECFDRVDQSNDGLVQREEFVEEVQRIAELLGMRATLDAIGEFGDQARAEQPSPPPGDESSSSSEEDDDDDRGVAAQGSSTAEGLRLESSMSGTTPSAASKPAAGAKAGKKKGRDKIPKADGAPKAAKGKRGKAKADKAPPASSASPPPAASPTPPPGPSPSGPARRPKVSADGEGVRCQKTLEFGKPIRSAICIGREVWTADWQGCVSVRDREDASKVLGEIPTNRFVWCMLHMKPGLMLMGQEAHGIAVFDSKKQEFRETLTGGHTGGISCLAVDDGGDEDAELAFPQRKIWSGSNDFTIRQWWVETWRTKGGQPTVPLNVDSEGTFLVDLGKWKVGIVRGQCLYGHKNGVRALLKIGPELWSGSDDGTIRVWRCGDGECTEVVEDAHQGAVNRLVIVRSSVWSAGADGVVKEWSLGGAARQCTRRLAPPGCEKGIYALLPLGHDVWVCGHHPAIQVLSQHGMQLTSEEDGHKPYVSNLIGVDRVETKVVWSTSFGDRKLKVWRHTIRGEEASVDELKAANLLYAQQQKDQDSRLGEYIRRIDSLQGEVDRAGEGFRKQLDEVNQELAEAKKRGDSLEDQKNCLERELAEIRQIFEEAGMGNLLSDPEALKAFVQRTKKLEEALKALGLEHLLDNPDELGQMLKSLLATKDVLERCGLAGALDDPSLLEAVLTRYNGLKEAFEKHDMANLFEDPQALDGFLGTYCGVRAEFQAAGHEHVLDDAEAAREFLEKRKQDELKLEELTNALNESMEKASNLEKELAQISEELEEARGGRGELEEQRQKLEDELASLRKAFDDAGLGHLLEDPEALSAFVARAAELERLLKEMGLEGLLDDPGELARLIESAQRLKEVLERCGFGSALDDPSALEDALSRYDAIRRAFEDNGFPELFQDPSQLAEIMSRYAALKAAFEEFGMEDHFEDPFTLKAFLKTNKRLREEFAKIKKEYLMDSVPSMRGFITEYTDMEHELVGLRQKAIRLKQLEEQLARGDAKLSQLTGDAETMRARLAAYEALGDIEAVRKWREDSEELDRMRRINDKLQDKIHDLEKELREADAEKAEALERERLMSVKYKELDIFKLDIIARELKGIDNDLGMVGSEAKTLITKADRLKNYDEQQTISHASDKMLDACKALRAHLRDVIHKCLSETQKMHIGVAIDDHTAAGELKDGGTMVVASYEEIERPDHGNSRAARLRQDDETRRHRPGR